MVRRCGHQVPRPPLPNSHISIYPWGRRNVKDGGNHTHTDSTLRKPRGRAANDVGEGKRKKTREKERTGRGRTKRKKRKSSSP